ncbi:MAG: hypothetical protein JST16_06370 [Bdellovibrionales bacterium]|nr:hypothetical protein [Bdellovibrionales bacterium]
MSPRADSAAFTGGSARCGRCAEILPDETLTYCPSCGVPFSRVPPTNSYIRFEERFFKYANARRRVWTVFLSAATLVACFALVTLLDAWSAGGKKLPLHAQRSLVIHFYDMPGYPTLSRPLKRESVNVALQAFEDHFGVTLQDYHITENTLPDSLKPYFVGAGPTRLTIWEEQIIPHLLGEWSRDPNGPLHAVVTNIPLFVDAKQPNIETRHLSASKMISGLGHPALVLVSTFRMLTELPEYRDSKLPIQSGSEQARHVGEYLLAHELGHALLGFTDFVIEKPVTPATLRAPASIKASSPYSQCLMHTDEAGGFGAWENIRHRTLGQRSTCHAYTQALRAVRLHEESLELLRSGQRKEAQATHAEAITEAQHSLNPWVAELWLQEHESFLSLGERWRKRLLMFQ